MVEVGQREHVHHTVARLHEVEVFDAVADVAQHRAVGEHDAFRHSCGAGSVVDDCQLVGFASVVADVFRSETVGIAASEELVEAVAGFGHLRVLAEGEAVFRDVDGRFETRHRGLVEVFPDGGVHEEHFGLRVVHEMVDGFRLELVEDGHRHVAAGDDGEESHGPVGRVLPAQGYLVARLEPCRLEHYVHLGYQLGHVLELVVGAPDVREGRQLPVFLD